MNHNFSVRRTRLLELPLAVGIELSSPEEIVVKFKHGKTLDIGSLCYSRRSSERRVIGNGKLVDEDSISMERTESVRLLIRHISDEVGAGIIRYTTLFSRYWVFVKFLDWSDANGFSSAIYDVDSAKTSFVAYGNWLREKILRNELAQNTVSQIQFCVFNILVDFLGLDEQREDFNLVCMNHNAANATELPADGVVARVLALCGNVFDGLANLIINNLPFPHAISVPEYIGCKNNKLWIFPTNLYFVSPSMMESRATRRRPHWQYNYVDGKMSTLEEIAKTESYCNRQAAMRVLKKGELQLQRVNSDKRNGWRIIFASICMNLFLLLLLSRSGSNWEQLRDLPWDNDYKVSSKRQGYRVLKWRAKGKRISIVIPVSLMPDFKRFLKVRDYLLGERECEYLFFGLGPSSQGEPSQIYDDVLRTIYETLRRIDPGLPSVSARQWRARKGDWFLRNYDVAAAAVALQNTDETIKNSYSSVSDDTQCEEFGVFFKGVEDAILPVATAEPSETPSAVGACKSMGNPKSLFEKPPIEPDCQKNEGCFFCENYKLHADERDTRKIISCRYCLEKTHHLTSAEEVNQAVIEPIFKRIDFFLGEIRKRDAEMVDRVTREVEEDGALDNYWLSKLEMLVELGVVN
ncbi:hypothetical protein [Paraburkholderia bannensis]|uniref:hypothetical protein n=1 Tax=Paraburkholderia bannensis TaxID=765414 RepID=UPI002ABD21F6|nr:hypothetical protein [Paraburkholderia bannensis]